jgi:hypothetical protein
MIIEFNDPRHTVDIEYPSLKIDGLNKGRRTMQWEGSFKITDHVNNLNSKITFSNGPTFTNKVALPIDCFEGSIIKNN